MTQGASLSLVGTTDADSQHTRRQPVPLTELAIANRQRDALYLLGEQLHRANSLEEIHAAAMDASNRRSAAIARRSCCSMMPASCSSSLRAACLTDIVER